MRILADENLDSGIVGWLRSLNHDIKWVLEEARGTEDIDVVSLAAAEERVLITNDLDFGELVVGHNLTCPGVILLRLSTMKRPLALARFQSVWSSLEPIAAHHFVVVTEHKVRVRELG